MTYCWEVFDQTKCESCKYFIAFKDGSLEINKAEAIIVVEED